LSLRRVSPAIALPLLAAAVSLSASCADLGECDGLRTIAVQPRVVIDGTVELRARSAQVIVDEVLFHAPTVELRADGQRLADLLESDPAERGPLLFRYDVTSDGFGDVIGGERRWALDPDLGAPDEGGVGADLVFGFAPFRPTDELREALEESTGVALGLLEGHTAVVHGYVLASHSTSSSHSATGLATGFGRSPCDGDPDGNPANCGAGWRSDGDPDGNPSKPGTEQDGDPDGNPAKPGGFRDGDPDGNPAATDPDGRRAEHKKRGGTGDGDPDGNPAFPFPVAGDPDGNPARVRGDASEQVRARTAYGALPGAPTAGTPTPAQTRVPFVLVFNRELALHVPVTSLFDRALAPDEVLPIDLHVRLDALLTEALLANLDEEASAEKRGAIVIEVPSAFVAIDVPAQGVARVRREAVTEGGIKVVGGIR
jgi:hypothetical protein